VAFTIEPQAGEELVFQGSFLAKKGVEPFAFALSNQAVYIPRKKLFAVSDPWYFERVPISQIREVALERLHPYLLWLLAIVFIAVGGVTSYGMLQPEYRDHGGTVSGYPFGLLAVGLVLPFVARGRRRLVVSMIDDRFQWKAPLVLDRPSRARIREVQQGIMSAFKQVHVLVKTE